MVDSKKSEMDVDISQISSCSYHSMEECEKKYITVPEKNHKLVPISQMNLITHCNNWAVYTKAV